MTRSIFKSIGAILVGILLIVLLDTGTDMILQKLGIFPSASAPFNITWMVLLASSYRTGFAIIGSWAAAAFAPSRPMFHALVIGILLLGKLPSTETAIEMFKVISGK